jgi:anti-sigma factor RsiW
MSWLRSPSELLHAYHDGELGGVARWRMERRLARDPAARRELARLVELRGAIRDVASGPPAPDLWSGIQAGLPSIDAGVDAAIRPPAFAGAPAWLRPLAAGALAAGIAAAWLVFSAPTDPVNGGVVRWLYTRGRPVMVLEQPNDATIIWLLDETPGDQTGRRMPGVYI